MIKGIDWFETVIFMSAMICIFLGAILISWANITIRRRSRKGFDGKAALDKDMKSWQDEFVQVDAKGKVTKVSETDGGKLFRWIMKNGPGCVECGSGLWSGPSGGASQNVYCSNAACREAYNITAMLGIAERIGKAPDHIYQEGESATTK